MARQNTFTIVPQAPRFNADAATTTPARPMTSKQVRQAYKAATKTPTLTRAERRQWEREEQERIRKELEKERAAAKARAAREKKKEKEAQQREEKRRSGMPLVNVRPSQDTIARFVRGNRSTRKRDAEGLVVTTPQTAESEKQDEGEATMPEVDSTPRRAAAHVLGSIVETEENLDDKAPANVTTEERRRANPDDNATKRTSVEEKQITPQDETTDKTIEQATAAPFQDFDVDLSFEEPIDEEAFDAALDLIPAFGAGQFPGLNLPSAAGAAAKETAILTPSQDLLDEDINTDMLEELDELLSGGKTPAKPVPAPSPKQEARIAHKAFRRTAPSSPGHGKRKPPSQRRSSPRQALPLATQAILSNADEFFPTLSQQMRELEEEQEASQEEVVRPLAHGAQQKSTPSDETSSKGASKCQPVSKSGGSGESDSGFGSFPSTTQFSPSPRRSSSRKQRQASVSSAHESVPAAAPEPPRFFTSSGSREQLALALQRSRRSAALEQIQRKERQRQEAGQLLLMRQAEDGAAHRRRRRSAELAMRKEPTGTPDKENGQPEMRCSQETEYGGDWVEDAAWDLALC